MVKKSYLYVIFFSWGHKISNRTVWSLLFFLFLQQHSEEERNNETENDAWQEWAAVDCKTNLQLVLLPVDDHCSNLLIHEYQYGDQQSRKSRCQVNPPGISSEGGHKPAPFRTGWLRSRKTESFTMSILNLRSMLNQQSKNTLQMNPRQIPSNTPSTLVGTPEPS